MTRLRRYGLPAIVMAAAVGYVLTTRPCVLGGDNGEFSTLFATGGIAHPPGYPSMVLWLRALHWLPASTAAKGAALATVPLGVLAVYLLQRACLAWGASVGATAVASALFAFSPMAWKMSCHAEVFAMNAAFAAAILWLSAPERAPLRGTALVVTLGLLAGFGLADQQSIVLLAPVGLLAGVRAARQAARPWATALLGALAAVIALMLPYLYVYVVARTSDPRRIYMWIAEPSLRGVWFQLTRGAYGTLHLAGIPHPRDPAENLTFFVPSLLRQTLGLPVLILGAGALWLARRDRSALPRARRDALIALAASFVLAGPLFVASFNLPYDETGPTVAERFYLLPEVLVALMGALAFDVLIPTLMAREWLAGLIAAQVAGVMAVFTVPEVLEHNRRTVELYVENTLRGAPANAILVGSGDHRFFGFLYAQRVLGLRPDVAFVTPPILNQRWYRQLIALETGIDVSTPGGGPVGPKTLMARLLASGRPVLFTDWFGSTLAETVPNYPIGTLIAALPEGQAPPDPLTLARMNLEVFGRYEMERTLPEDPHGWGYGLQADYARPWLALARAFAALHDEPSARACFTRVATLAPWLLEAPR